MMIEKGEFVVMVVGGTFVLFLLLVAVLNMGIWVVRRARARRRTEAMLMAPELPLELGFNDLALLLRPAGTTMVFTPGHPTIRVTLASDVTTISLHALVRNRERAELRVAQQAREAQRALEGRA